MSLGRNLKLTSAGLLSITALLLVVLALVASNVATVVANQYIKKSYLSDRYKISVSKAHWSWAEGNLQLILTDITATDLLNKSDSLHLIPQQNSHFSQVSSPGKSIIKLPNITIALNPSALFKRDKQLLIFSITDLNLDDDLEIIRAFFATSGQKNSSTSHSLRFGQYLKLHNVLFSLMLGGQKVQVVLDNAVISNSPNSSQLCTNGATPLYLSALATIQQYQIPITAQMACDQKSLDITAHRFPIRLLLGNTTAVTAELYGTLEGTLALLSDATDATASSQSQPRFSFQFSGQNGTLSAPELPEINIHTLSLSGAWLDNNTLILKSFATSLNQELYLEGSGSFGNENRFSLKFTKPIDLAALEQRYWSPSLLPKIRDWIGKNIQAATFSHVEILLAKRNGELQQLELNIGLKDVELDQQPSMTFGTAHSRDHGIVKSGHVISTVPHRTQKVAVMSHDHVVAPLAIPEASITARFQLNKGGSIAVKTKRSKVGRAILQDMSAIMSLSSEGKIMETAQISFRTNNTVADTLTTVCQYLSNRCQDLISLDHANSRVLGDVRLDLSFKPHSSTEIKGRVSNFRINKGRDATARVSAPHIDFHIRNNRATISTELTVGKLHSFPLTAEYDSAASKNDPYPRLIIHGTLYPDLFGQSDIWSAGPINFRSVGHVSPKEASGHLTLSLDNAALKVPFVSISKAQATPGNINLDFKIQNKVLSASAYSVDLPDLQSAGRFAWDMKNGILQYFHADKISLHRGNYSLQYDSRTHGQHTFNVSGDSLDLSILDSSSYKKSGTTDKTPWTLALNTNLKKIILYNNKELVNPQFSLHISDNKLQKIFLDGCFSDNSGFVTLFYDTPVISLVSNNFSALLQALNISSKTSGGNVEIKGMISDDLRWADGYFDIHRFEVQHSPVLGIILGIASTNFNIFKMLRKKHEVSFGKCECDLHYAGDTLRFDSCNFKGDSIFIRGKGLYEFHAKAGQFRGVALPMNIFNTLLLIVQQTLPGLGLKLLEGNNDRVNFEVDLENGKVNVKANPLSLLTPGFLGEIFETKGHNRQPRKEPEVITSKTQTATL